MEHDRCVFEIEVEEEDAEVTWRLNGRPLSSDDPRVSISSEGKKRKLVINDMLLSDSGEVSVDTNVDSSKTALKVARESLASYPAKIQ